MQFLYAIHWDVNPVIFESDIYSLRYYTVLFVLGLFLSACVVSRIFKEKHLSEDDFHKLAVYLLVGIVIGARVGHCLFYEPEYYLKHPLEIILPFTFENGNFVMTGYQGLASHGGAVGVIIALAFYCYKTKQKFIPIIDIIAIVAPLAAGFIRLANLMNSEIIGNVTTVPWAFRFMRVDGLPRHPTQLYEAIAYFVLFFINIILYKKWGERMKPGFFFGLTLSYIFIFRFFIEFLKEDQVSFESSMSFNMGQLLSIPYILVGLYFMFLYKRKSFDML